MSIKISYEKARGCGYRKIGGLYLVCDGTPNPCEILPLELHTCPTCGAGIKQARGWTWIAPLELFKKSVCEKCKLIEGKTDFPYEYGGIRYSYCRFTKLQKAGLLWVGEKFYSSPKDFINEAKKMGISRRIKAIPRDFVLGETWVLLAHAKVDFEEIDKRNIQNNPLAAEMILSMPRCRPAIFAAFLPQRIEKIISGNDSLDEILRLEKIGITPVKVERIGESLELEDSDNNNDELEE